MGIYYMGIDPGMSGGLSVIGNRFESPYIHSSAMPKTERDTSDWIGHYFDSETFAVIEKVHAMPKQGVSSTFKFGHNYGFLRGCLVSYAIPFVEVSPKTWQKRLDIPPRKKTETKTQWKNRLKQLAQQQFPETKVTLANADSLLIALYCSREHGGGNVDAT